MRTLPFVLLLTLGLCHGLMSKTIYVDDDASTGGDGTSWASAYKYLQDALADVNASDEIWVAEGTYKPDQGVGITEGNRTVSFNLVNGVGMYGGFSGTETTRTPLGDGNQTILSGEIDADSTLWSLHVVRASGEVTLDGFQVTKGNANGARGGGIFATGSLAVSNCTFSNNSAGGSGGGICGWGRVTTLKLTNCIFSNNSANAGGGVDGKGTFTNCRFSNNSADSNGGGLIISGSLLMSNCRFINNSADSGGGVSGSNGRHLWNTFNLTNCIFFNNSATNNGGGVRIYQSRGSMFTNCTFANNSADSGGGVSSSDPFILANCTFSKNSATTSGGGVQGWGTVNLTNCIFWKNYTNGVEGHGFTGSFVSKLFQPGITPTYTGDPNAKAPVHLIQKNILQSWTANENAFSADPLFVNINDPNGPDDKWFTDDDGLRLISGSAAIDSGGSSHSLPIDVTDLDKDGNTTESIPYDLLGRTRLVGSAVDLGPYEFDPANAPPVVNTASIVAVKENDVIAIEFNATDHEAKGLTYLITGGSDRALFDLNESTGTIAFKVAPDYENPTDSDSNNTYVLRTTLHGGEATVAETFTVKVVDVNEAPLLIKQKGALAFSIPEDSGPQNLLGLGSKIWDKIFLRNWQRREVCTSVLSTSDGGYLFAGDRNNGFWALKADANGTMIWDKKIDSGNCNDLVGSPDGGYLMIGSLDRAGRIVKIDANGTKIWDKTFFLNDSDWGASLSAGVVSKDEGFVLVGTSSAIRNNNSTNWILKIDANGTKIWDKTFEGGYPEALMSCVVSVTGGGYLLSTLRWVAKIDEGGTVVWERTYDGQVADILPVSDGNFLLTGRCNWGDSLDFWALKMNAEGSKIWEKSYDGEGRDSCNAAVETSDGGFILGGTSTNPPMPQQTNRRAGARFETTSKGPPPMPTWETNEAWVLKIDLDGNLLWSKSFDGGYYDSCVDIVSAGDGNFVLAVHTTTDDPSRGNGRRVFEDGRDKTSKETGSSLSLGSDIWAIKIKDRLNAWDPEGYPLTWSLKSEPLHGIAMIVDPRDASTITYSPNTNFNGQDSLELMVSDGELSETIEVKVTVTPENDPPDIPSTQRNNTVSLTLLEGRRAVRDFNATDVDDDLLEYSLTGGADQDKFTINAETGVLEFISAPDFENPDDEDGSNTYIVGLSVLDDWGRIIDDLLQGSPANSSGKFTCILEISIIDDPDDDPRSKRLGGIPMGDNWYSSDWLGVFWDSGSGWIYHSDHGWLYPYEGELRNFWFYHAELGWFWTNSTLYGTTDGHCFLFSKTHESWLYYYSEDKNFYSYKHSMRIDYQGFELVRVSIESSDEEMGFVPRGGYYKVGSTTFTAVPAEGHKFVEWRSKSRGVLSNDPELVIELKEHEEIIGFFTKKTKEEILLEEIFN